MAVKPITNKQVVSKGQVNRSDHLSFRDETLRTGNKSQSFTPGKDFTKNFSITLKDIDTAILSHVKEVIKPTVREAGEVVKVPVMWANEERWKSVRKNGVLRDKNNVIILPLVVIKRTDTSFNDMMPFSFKHDVQNKYAQVVRGRKWSKDNRYDRFSVQTNTKPAFETITTGMPDFVVCNYQFVVLTNYMEQMNYLNELWIEHSQKYWGASEEYKFLSSLEGGIADASEMTVDSERLIRNEFTMSVKGYLVPEFISNVFGKNAHLTRNLTPNKVVFGFEGDATNKQVGK